MPILVSVILPVLLVTGVAALAQALLRLDVDTLSRVAFYLFGTALVFDAMVTADIGGQEFGLIAAVVLLTTLALWALGAVVARLLRLSGGTKAAFLAAVIVMNCGNLGLPVTLFAFGTGGLARATVYVVVISILISSLGVYITASGRASAGLALRRVVTIPILYAAILGLVINLGRLGVPEPLMKAVRILGQAAVPTMLLVLGIQLAATLREQRSQLPVPALVAVTILRLIVAPAVAWAFALLLGLPELGKDVVVLESAMPTGVTATILASQFDADSRFSALCVAITTLVSLPTLTLLLNWLS